MEIERGTERKRTIRTALGTYVSEKENVLCVIMDVDRHSVQSLISCINPPDPYPHFDFPL